LKCTGECPCRKYTASAKSADAWIFSSSVRFITSLIGTEWTISCNFSNYKLTRF
jgi:hypothetical protein